MKTVSLLKTRSGGKLVPTIVLSSILLGACAASPTTPQAALDVREKLTELQSDPEMANNARNELRSAEEAVRIAEQPLGSGQADLADYRIYMADHMVEIARAKGTTRLLETERTRMGEQRDAARLTARTLEADRAQADAETARSSEAAAAALSAAAAADLQRRIDDLEAEATERGLVLTLGDVLFATGSAEIQGGSNRNLEKLVGFLNEYPDRNVVIEGHTDNVGSAQFNQTLSLQRAESVRRHLSDHGVERRRLTVNGYGLERPVASNESEAGRQQNRRVEVIIEN